VKVRNNDSFTWTDCWVQFKGRSHRLGSVAANTLREVQITSFSHGVRRQLPNSRIGITCAEGIADFMP